MAASDSTELTGCDRPVAIDFLADGSGPDERRAWAMEMAALLLGTVLPAGTQGPVLRCTGSSPYAQASEPVGFTLSDKPYVADARKEDGSSSSPPLSPTRRSSAPVHHRARRQRKGRRLSPKADTTPCAPPTSTPMDWPDEEARELLPALERAADTDSAPESPTARAARARPGRGGRQPRLKASAETEATGELRELLGEPDSYANAGTRVQRYLVERARPDSGILHPDGDGMFIGRLSAYDIQKGETIMGQVHGQRQMGEQQRLRPREILITTNNSGFNAYKDRADFNIVRDEIAAGRVKWVAWRAPERIGRALLPTLQFYDLLEKTGTDLYLTSLGRKVHWRRDRVVLNALGMVAEEEGVLIKERTHGALKRRWLEEGRGWPNAIPFGFRRNEHTRYLEVDPEQWPWVKRMHYGYEAATARDRGGLRGLSTELAAEGFPISVDRLRTILHDPMYVTGEKWTTSEGERIASRPVELKDPVPVDVFETNQRLLRVRKGRYTTHPVGTYVLNRVPIYHARCQDELVEDQGRPVAPMLRRRAWNGGRKGRTKAVYGHTPRVPECCRGYTIDAELLERPVLRELRKLAADPELQAAWTQAAFPEIAPRTEVLDGRAREAIVAQIATGQKQLQRLQREWSDRLMAGEELQQRDYDRMTGPLHGELDALEQQLATLEVATDDRAEHTVRVDERERGNLANRLQEILTDDCPADPDLRLRRAAFVEAALSSIIIHDVAAEERVVGSGAGEHAPDRRPALEARASGGIRIELFGPLLPATVVLVDGFDPLAHGSRALA